MKTLNKNEFIKYFISIFLIVSFTTLSIKAWNGLTASQGDKLDYQKWNQLIINAQTGTPTGSIMAFDLPNCPMGWTEVTNAKGRTIIGAGNGAGSNTTVGDVGGEKSAPAINLNANLVVSASAKIAGGAPQAGNSNQPTNNAIMAKPALGAANIYTSTGVADTIIGPNGGVTGTATGIITGGGTAPDNMQPYIAYIYCQKN